MNEKIYKVVKGYSELEYSERKEVRDFIEQYERKGFEDRKPLIKSLSDSVGPIDQNSCPCCGR
jgi:hypothetical protein